MDLASIPVHQVSLTSVRSLPDEDGGTVLFAAVGVWCDLDSLPDEAMPWAEGDEVPSVRVVDAYTLPDRTRVALSVQASDMTETDVADGAEQGLDLSPFTLVVPATALGLVNALFMAPTSVHLVLIDGLPPQQPELAVLDQDTIAALVDLDPRIVHGALCGVVEPALHVPLPFEPDEHDHDHQDASGGARPMRDTLWAGVSGIAFGQQWALNRIIDLGVWSQSRAMNAEHAEAGYAGDLVMDAARLADSSYDAFKDTGADMSLDSLPAPMAALADEIRDKVSVEALLLLLDGVAFSRVAAEHGMDAAIPALAVVAAARAHAVAAIENESGATPTWLLGAWLDSAHAEPTWATRPLLDLLTHHDPVVAADLLGIGPAGATAEQASEMLYHYLHVATDTMFEMQISPDELGAAFAEHTVRPANYHDVTLLAASLLEVAQEAAEDEDMEGECTGCAATRTILDAGWNLQRLAAAAAALLPCLADVSAADQGLPVGDQEWVSHRTAFIGRHLDIVARSTNRAA